MWESIFQLNRIFRSSFLRGLALLLGSNFSFDIISFIIRGNWDIYTLLAPALLAWLFVGYITGTIAKGIKNGFISGILVWIIVMLLWILIAVIAGEDLMAFFQGNQLIRTLGGITSSFLGIAIASILGGFISGPEENFL